MRLALALALTLLTALPAQALDAVGRVNVAGYNRTETCSGTLVRPDLVLTAAHCVADWQDGYAKRIADMVFVAGWDGAGHAGAARVASIRVHPQAFADGSLDLAHDLALIALETALDLPGVAVGSAAPQGPFRIEGYGRTRPHRVSVAEGCAGTPRGAVWHLSCPVEKGQSGGPVLYGEGAAQRIVAVVVGTVPDGSLAVPVDGWVRRALAETR